MNGIDTIRGLLSDHELPLSEALGMQFELLSAGEVVATLEAGTRHHNPMGTVHGGVLSTLADSAMGLAVGSTLDEGESFTTLELHLNFLRPAIFGPLRATGTVRQRGRSVALTVCDVTDERGRLIATATATNMILTGEKAAGRRPGDFLAVAAAGK